MHNDSDLALGPLRSSRNLVTAPAKALFIAIRISVGWLVVYYLSMSAIVPNSAGLGWALLPPLPSNLRRVALESRRRQTHDRHVVYLALSSMERSR